jgi:hypothetical protein
MLVYCADPQHKKIERMVPMETRPDKFVKAIVEDPASMCFRNSTGDHVTPRRCLCMNHSAPKEDRQVSRWKDHEKFPTIADRLNRDGDGKVTQKTIPVGVFREFMLSIHGKQNPACPIEDAHMPIDPNTSV